MHELSLMGEVLDAVVGRAAADRFSRVQRIRLEVGMLCAVEPEALRFCFDVVTRGTLAESATLEIAAVPGDGWCRACARSVPIHSRILPCEGCGKWDLTIRGGDQIRIVELEVE